MKYELSRRELLSRTLHVSAGGITFALLSACGRGSGTSGESTAAANVCADPAKLDPSQNSLRESLHYAEMSPNPATVCAGCAYSHFAKPGDMCGRCDIYSGGPVNARGHCDSWSKRAS